MNSVVIERDQYTFPQFNLCKSSKDCFGKVLTKRLLSLSQRLVKAARKSKHSEKLIEAPIKPKNAEEIIIHQDNHHRQAMVTFHENVVTAFPHEPEMESTDILVSKTSHVDVVKPTMKSLQQDWEKLTSILTITIFTCLFCIVHSF